MPTTRRQVDRSTDYALARRTLIVSGIALGILALGLLLWSLVDVLLLVFAAVLVAILLRGPADWIAQRTPLSPRMGLGVVVLTLIAVVGGAGWLFGHNVSDQFEQLAERVPQVLGDLRARLSRYDWLMSPIRDADLADARSELVGRGLGVISTTFGAISSLLLVLVLAAFLSWEPRIYVKGFVSLFTLDARPRVEEVLDSIGAILTRWLIGQLTLMVVVGLLTGIGLWLLGVPLALGLGVLTGLLNFVPYLGPILAAVPAVLIGLSVSPLMAGYVLLLYIAVQAIEGNLLEPVVQRRAVYLPPAFILVSQVLMGILTGVAGVLLATPLMAAVSVAVQKIYIRGVLGDRSAD